MTAKKMFYSMGEVSEMFDVNPSLIRHWESKFDCLRPHKNKKGNRMFSPSDVEKLKQIYHLVKERGMTLEGANKAMKGSRGGVSRDTELLERLQRIRAALEEVREELRDGSQDEIVDADADLVPDAAMPSETVETVAAETDMVQTADADGAEDVAQEPLAEDVAAQQAEAVEEPAASSEPQVEAQAEPQPEPRAEDKAEEQPEPEPIQDSPGQPERPTAAASAVSPKSRTRRRRKSDDEDKEKELFPFYEQSLF
ncbi:MAG: MerR family transcriptional regulator [Alistipes sp.]|nr:MerR family transcriptional regulator [Alistipes sp.]